MGRKYIGGIIGADPLPGGSVRPGVSNLGSLGGDVAASGDADFDSVVLLLDGTSVNDGSTGGLNDATLNGDASANDTTVTDPYGGSTGSYKLDGTGDTLTISDSTDFDFGSGDWTVECWCYHIGALAANAGLFGKRAGGAYAPFNVLGENNTDATKALRFFGDTGTGGSPWAISITGTSDFPTNQWVHFAVTRSGNTYTIWQNGVDIGSTTVSGSLMTNTDPVVIGASETTLSGTNYWNGYVKDFRITKGVVRYTSSFTPPASALPTTGTVAGATRPTRKWGGLVGRSLIVTTTTELTELPHSPSASIYKGDTTQGSQTLSTNGTDPTFSGSGIDSYHTPLNSSYYSYSPATAATAWTAFYDWEMNSATYPYLASYGTTSGAVRRFYTHSNDIKVYKGSGIAGGDFPTMIPSLTDGQRYRAAFRWDGTNLRSYLVSGTAKITVLPSASATFTQDFDLDGNTHSIGVNSTNFNAAEDLESPLYAYGFYESALTDSQMVDVFNALNNIGSESETLVKTGVLSLAEHYQSKL